MNFVECCRRFPTNYRESVGIVKLLRSLFLNFLPSGSRFYIHINGMEVYEMDKHRQDFAKRLAGAMTQKGWNQSELARRADIGRDNVSGYVRGHNLPNSKHLAKLAAALNVPASYLLGAATGDRFPALADDDKPLTELRNLPDKPGYMRVLIRHDVPEEMAFEIAKMVRKVK